LGPSSYKHKNLAREVDARWKDSDELLRFWWDLKALGSLAGKPSEVEAW